MRLCKTGMQVCCTAKHVQRQELICIHVSQPWSPGIQHTKSAHELLARLAQVATQDRETATCLKDVITCHAEDCLCCNRHQYINGERACHTRTTFVLIASISKAVWPSSCQSKLPSDCFSAPPTAYTYTRLFGEALYLMHAYVTSIHAAHWP